MAEFAAGTGTGFGPKGGDIVPPTSHQRGMTVRKLIESHLTMGGKANRFNFRALQAQPESNKRGIGVKLSTTDQSKVSYDKIRDDLILDWNDLYGDAMANYRYIDSKGNVIAKPLTSDMIDLDHRLTLVQSLGMYHNVPPKGKLWQRIQNTALRRGYKPGDTLENLALVDPESHRVKTNFFDDLHGLRLKGKDKNMRYWNGTHRNTGKTRMEIMEQSHLNKKNEDLHIEVVEDYLDKVDEGAKILDDSLRLWRAENPGTLPDEIVSKLVDISLDPKITKYSPRRLKRIIQDVAETSGPTRDKKDWALAFGDVNPNKIRNLIRLESKERGLEMLGDATGITVRNGKIVLVEPLSSKQIKAKHFPKVSKEESDITMKQLTLAIDELNNDPKVKENFMQLMRSRRGGIQGVHTPSDQGQD